MLLEGVPEKPKRPLKPGRFRDATDVVGAYGVEYLTAQMSPAWRIESDVIALLEDVDRGELASHAIHAAGRFHYRFARIHPFCDGNGRLARALATFLVASEHPEVLNFEKPINRIILEHREDYIGVLEYCDGIYEDLNEENIPEEAKLRKAEEPFSAFLARAILQAYRDHNEKLHRRLQERGLDVRRLPEPVLSVYDLSVEAIKAEHPWDDTIKGAIVTLHRLG